jgi:hypothetical protein
MSDEQILAEHEARVTKYNRQRTFRQELWAIIESAQAHGLEGGDIAYTLRSIASDISKQWNAELDRRNAQHIERNRAAAE